MIELDSVTFRYPKSTADALSNISLNIPQGSFFALIGPNGAGKTTLLRLLCGRLGAFKGSVKIDESLRNSAGFLNAEKYGVLLENPGVYPKLSIKEYLQYFTGFYGFGAEEWRENGAMLERCKSFAERLKLPPLDKRLETLSLGNRQKVQIVRAQEIRSGNCLTNGAKKKTERRLSAPMCLPKWTSGRRIMPLSIAVAS